MGGGADEFHDIVSLAPAPMLGQGHAAEAPREGSAARKETPTAAQPEIGLSHGGARLGAEEPGAAPSGAGTVSQGEGATR